MTDAEARKIPEKEDIPSLKSRLEEARKKKEEWFRKKEDLKLETANLIKQIKVLKMRSDSSTKSISQIKAERDKCNEEVRELILKAGPINKERKDKLAKAKLKIDPSSIKSQIERLEFKIETDALSFDKEKKVMKQINELRKQYGEMKEVIAVSDKLSKVSRQIDAAKTKAEDFHKQMRDSLSKNRRGYSEFMKLSKKISELKGTQEMAFKNFTGFKKEFSEISRLLKDKLGERQAETRKQAKEREGIKKVKADDNKKKLDEKIKAVEEKVRSRKILTTEDLIAFQGSNQ